MNSNLLLVHSPLVGPSVWGPLVAHLAGLGATVACPDLTDAVVAPVVPGGPSRMERFVDAAAEAALSDEIVLVGFSGAGVMLPNVAARLGGRVAVTVYVDAVVPPASGIHEVSEPFAGFLDTQTVNGVLAPWIDWWPDAIAKMLPDETLRHVIAADMPRVPRQFYDETLEVPEQWAAGSNRYLQLSRAYDADRELAESHGWPTATINGTHLSIATDPAAVVSAIDLLLR